jgi:hypothetical protein
MERAAYYSAYAVAFKTDTINMIVIKSAIRDWAIVQHRVLRMGEHI